MKREDVIRMILPLLEPSITSLYGTRRADGKVHTGLDMISLRGDKNVKAIADGVVRVTVKSTTGFGNYISIEQEDGIRALYCHLESFKVKVGDKIKAGDVIGIEGMTGNATGVHLHLELRKSPYKSSDHINPAEYLGILNQLGRVQEVVVVPVFETGEDALNYLIERNRILDADYWTSALAIVNNFDWILIKWANDVVNLEN